VSLAPPDPAKLLALHVAHRAADAELQ
jgi:hypothetical protein